MAYLENELLMLSGIQHFYFCKRQWALIHIEQQWEENKATVEGKIIHENVDDKYFFESRDNTFISRSVPLVSYQLGLYGIADAIEFTKKTTGLTLPGHFGKWFPSIIEYKRGKPKADERDELQLTAQIMSFEEMVENAIEINFGYLYYHLIRRRIKIEITKHLRFLAKKISEEMHYLYKNYITPPATCGKRCSICSLYNICVPRLTKKKQNIENYINSFILEE